MSNPGMQETREQLLEKISYLEEMNKELFGGTKRDLAYKLQQQVEKNIRLMLKAERDADRLDWLTRNISGSEFRRIGVIWSAWSPAEARKAIDTARFGESL